MPRPGTALHETGGLHPLLALAAELKCRTVPFLLASQCSQLEALTCPLSSLLSLMHGMPAQHLLLAEGEVSGPSVHSSPWILSHEHRSTGPYLRVECKQPPW